LVGFVRHDLMSLEAQDEDSFQTEELVALDEGLCSVLDSAVFLGEEVVIFQGAEMVLLKYQHDLVRASLAPDEACLGRREMAAPQS
jgi:hypothetical protein